MRPLEPSSAVGVAVLCAVRFLAAFLFSTPAASGADAEYLPVCNLPKCLNPQVTAKSGIGTANATTEGKVTPEDAAKWCATYKPRDKFCPKEQVQTG